ncbi:MAG: alpha/beta hydrolase [Eubacterium sp.]|nr:alpha/beta hydrolase [Eubacterium sp.]
MEVREWTWFDIPEYEGTPEGAERITPNPGDEVGVMYIPDVEYAEVDGIHLKLQILRPMNRRDPMRTFPCICYVPGSAWQKQEMYMNLPELAALAKRGYVVAAIQYRHSRQATFPAQIQDMKNAIRFMKFNAMMYGADPSKFFVAGSSSGGHTAMFNPIIYDWHIDDRNMFGMFGVNAKVKGIINYFGSVSCIMPDGNPTTINHKLPWSPEGMFLGCNLYDNWELAKKATVVENITPELPMPPVCIFHGTKDTVVNTKQSVELYEKLKECGKDVRLYLVEGADHGGGEFSSDKVLDKVDEFIRYCLEKNEEA